MPRCLRPSPDHVPLPPEAQPDLIRIDASSDPIKCRTCGSWHSAGYECHACALAAERARQWGRDAAMARRLEQARADALDAAHTQPEPPTPTAAREAVIWALVVIAFGIVCLVVAATLLEGLTP